MTHVDGEGSNWRRRSLAGEQSEQIHDKNAFVLLEQRKIGYCYIQERITKLRSLNFILQIKIKRDSVFRK